MSYYSKLLKDIVAIEKKAGKIILSAKSIDITNKSNTHDMVTQYDKAVQKTIFDFLTKKYPNVKIIGEEENLGEKIDPYKGEVFIIDPIDGTSNFINGLNESAISIAYVVDISRGTINPLRRFVDYLFLLSFFPKMFLGPLVK